MSVSYAVRVDEEIRDGASAVAKKYGLDLATATRAFWTQMARTGTIPLSFDYDEPAYDGAPNEDSLEAIRETEEIFANGGGRRFKTVDALVAALEE